jgi:hypothetical protein
MMISDMDDNKMPLAKSREKQSEAQLGALRIAIDEGDASGVAHDDVFGRLCRTEVAAH